MACIDMQLSREVVTMKEINDQYKLECEYKFCYLSIWEPWLMQVEENKKQEQKYTLWTGKVQGTGSSAEVKVIFPPFERKGRLYLACIQRVLEYATETWAMKMEDMARLECMNGTVNVW